MSDSNAHDASDGSTMGFEDVHFLAVAQANRQRPTESEDLERFRAVIRGFHEFFSALGQCSVQGDEDVCLRYYAALNEPFASIGIVLQHLFESLEFRSASPETRQRWLRFAAAGYRASTGGSVVPE